MFSDVSARSLPQDGAQTIIIVSFRFVPPSQKSPIFSLFPTISYNWFLVKRLTLDEQSFIIVFNDKEQHQKIIVIGEPGIVLGRILLESHNLYGVWFEIHNFYSYHFPSCCIILSVQVLLGQRPQTKEKATTLSFDLTENTSITGYKISP